MSRFQTEVTAYDTGQAAVAIERVEKGTATYEDLDTMVRLLQQASRRAGMEWLYESTLLDHYEKAEVFEVYGSQVEGTRWHYIFWLDGDTELQDEECL